VINHTTYSYLLQPDLDKASLHLTLVGAPSSLESSAHRQITSLRAGHIPGGADAMKRLPATDAAFLHGETPAMHTHVPGLLLLRPAPDFDVETFRQHLATRLVTIPQFRWRVVQVPLGLDRPVWVDADFNPLDHITHHLLPQPGTLDQLFELAARDAELKLDRSRPLWQFTIVEGLEDGRVALLTKTHHAMFDGMGALALGAALYDPSDEPRTVDTTVGSAGSDVPSDVQRAVTGAVRSTLAAPVRVGRIGTQLIRQGAALAASFAGGDPLPVLPTSAPNTPYNGRLTPRRAFVGHSLPLDQVKALRRAAQRLIPDVKLNDVVLTIIGGALRSHLQELDALPKSSLIASVAIDVRTDNSLAGGNEVSGSFVQLRTDLDDVLLRLEAIHLEMVRAKATVKTLMAHKKDGLTAVGPPALVSILARTYSQLNLEDHVRPTGNIVVSSMPGPPIPLYIGGHRLEHIFGMGPLILGGGLNLTCLSYDTTFDIGITSCPDVCPDMRGLPARIDEAFQGLQRVLTG
jgi:diacylglycerol O-acyltransferase